MWNIYNIQNNLNLDKNLLHFIHIFLCGKKGMTKKNKETGGKGDEWEWDVWKIGILYGWRNYLSSEMFVIKGLHALATSMKFPWIFIYII